MSRLRRRKVILLRAEDFRKIAFGADRERDKSVHLTERADDGVDRRTVAEKRRHPAEEEVGEMALKESALKKP
jgi:hypothetical protein